MDRCLIYLLLRYYNNCKKLCNVGYVLYLVICDVMWYINCLKFNYVLQVIVNKYIGMENIYFCFEN